MSVLVIAEHDQNNIKVQTQVAVAAAKAIGGDIHILVAGQNCQGAADAAAKVEGVQKVLLADHENYGHALAEELSNLIVSVAEGLLAHSDCGDHFRQKLYAAGCCFIRCVTDLRDCLS